MCDDHFLTVTCSNYLIPQGKKLNAYSKIRDYFYQNHVSYTRQVHDNVVLSQNFSIQNLTVYHLQMIESLHASMMDLNGFPTNLKIHGKQSEAYYTLPFRLKS